MRDGWGRLTLFYFVTDYPTFLRAKKKLSCQDVISYRVNYETNGKISVGGNKGSEAHFSLSRERERRKTFKENCKRVEKFIKIQVDFATSSRALEISR